MSQKRIFVPTRSAEDWRQLLAKPDRQWRDGYSAKSAAERWERFAGLPPEITDQFVRAGFPAPLLVLAIPEFKTDLPGGGAPSQSDIFCVVKSGSERIAAAVEAKVAESFGETLGEWLASPSPGKKKRIDYICQLLDVDGVPSPSLRYQLFHRSAAAIVEAQNFGFKQAAMIVHSFSITDQWIDDFQAFRRALDISAGPFEPATIRLRAGVQFTLGWAKGAP